VSHGKHALKLTVLHSQDYNYNILWICVVLILIQYMDFCLFFTRSKIAMRHLQFNITTWRILRLFSWFLSSWLQGMVQYGAGISRNIHQAVLPSIGFDCIDQVYNRSKRPINFLSGKGLGSALLLDVQGRNAVNYFAAIGLRMSVCFIETTAQISDGARHRRTQIN
jgi:hypothetical protein